MTATRLFIMFLGGAVGAFVGDLVGNLIIDKLHQEEEEPYHWHPPLDDEEDEEEEEKEEKEEKEEESSDPFTPEVPKSMKLNEFIDYTKFKTMDDKPNLSSLAKKYVKEEEEKKPHIISFEDYIAQIEYGKLSYTYFAKDNYLTDEKNQVLKGYTSYLGSDVFENFGHLSDDPDVVYIRNDEQKIDYEIVRVHRSYVEEEHGAEFTKKESKKKTTKPSRTSRSRKVLNEDEEDDGEGNEE